VRLLDGTDGLLNTLSGAYIQIPGEPGAHYGYGLMHFEERGVRLVMHGGFSRGYGSMIQMAPEHGFAVIVVSNRSGETLPRTCEIIKKMFLPRGAEVAAVKQGEALVAGTRGGSSGSMSMGRRRGRSRSAAVSCF
jgi:CubicO group peptidase (beta-lactamase class C family)